MRGQPKPAPALDREQPTASLLRETPANYQAQRGGRTLSELLCAISRPATGESRFRRRRYRPSSEEQQ